MNIPIEQLYIGLGWFALIGVGGCVLARRLDVMSRRVSGNGGCDARRPLLHETFVSNPRVMGAHDRATN